jgi:hypothetical protein
MYMVKAPLILPTSVTGHKLDQYSQVEVLVKCGFVQLRRLDPSGVPNILEWVRNTCNIMDPSTLTDLNLRSTWHGEHSLDPSFALNWDLMR